MADKKQKKQEPATIDEVRALIEPLLQEMRLENKVQYEQVIHRMESILCKEKAKAPKKEVVRKAADSKKKGKAELPASFSNTMYWWTAMFAVGDESVKKMYTEEDVKKAMANIDGIKDKPEGYDKQRVIGLQIWKGFPKSKKSGEIKTQFDNWKKEKEKENTKNIEKEDDTDDEKEKEVDENTTDDNEEEGDDE